MNPLPNILIVIALVLAVADLIWPANRLTTVAVILVCAASLAGIYLHR